MLRQSARLLIRLMLFLLVVLVIVSLFGGRFGINVERFKRGEYNLLFLVSLGIIIILLILSLRDFVTKRRSSK